jgi:glycosyltransferase involved in cell wall biosynthesis
MSELNRISVVIPAKNEAASIAKVVSGVLDALPVAEVIVVNDGSTDDTQVLAEQAGAKVLTHLYSRGNGAAIKSGARAASGDVLVFMDADGQHKPEDIPRLLAELENGFDMVVGARSNDSQASKARGLGNKLYNRLASWVVSQSIKDLTSGFRVVRAKRFKELLYLLPNGFSYPTTSTMAFFRAGYGVQYVDIVAESREDDSQSHIRLIRDGIKFLLIIFKVGVLYSPLKLFVPASAVFFLLGSFYYGYTYLADGRFTNMSALLFVSSVIIFMMGLISEQITMLLYKESADNE